MNARLHTALESAAHLCREEATRIRAALPDEDGAPDAPPRKTPDGLWESDADEWDEDARLIEEHMRASGWPADWQSAPARVAEERTNT